MPLSLLILAEWLIHYFNWYDLSSESDWQINWQTQRLHIRRFQIDDYAQELRYASDPEIMRYIDDVDDLVAVEAKVKVLLAPWQGKEGEWLLLPVCLSAQSKTSQAKHIGMVCLRFESVAFKRVEIGYRFAPEYHGQGYGLEAAKALVKFLFEQIKFNKVRCLLCG